VFYFVSVKIVGMSKYKLNPEQIEAVRHGNGPLLIIAGAGTGKTTVITERIKYLVTKGLANPSEILGLTFTEKASMEMESRVDEALPYGYIQMWIMTFHSFCDRILRSEALHIGLDPKYKLLSESEAVQLVRKNLFAFELDYFRPLANPTKYIEGMLDHFSRLQDEDITPEQYLKWAHSKSKKKKLPEEAKLESQKWLELAKAYKTYDDLKIKGGYMDFGDLIAKSLLLFRTRPNILKKYQKQFKYILVDEYQDTNYSQNELVRLLAGENGNITVVADDDQAIYRWRGAAISNVIQFRKYFPGVRVVTLTKNYRSNQEILDKAYNLIQFNNPDRLEVVEKIDKKLVSMVKQSWEKDEDVIEFVHLDRVENEADWVAKKIRDMVISGQKYKYSDFAILVRANNHADVFVRALSRIGIPHQFLGPGRLFRQPEIIDLIAYLKVLNDIDDSVSMYRLLSMDSLEISGRDLAAITSYARKKNISLFAACEDAEKILLSPKGKEKVVRLTKVILKHLNMVKGESAGQLLFYFLQDMGIVNKMLNPDKPLAEKKAMNISRFFNKLRTYETEHDDSSVGAVVEWIDLASELGESPLASNDDWTGVNAVNLLTVHGAKGLEFPVVFLVNLVNARFPSTERKEQIPIPDELVKELLPLGDYHIQEERRLFYVGMTRAQEKLFLTASDYYGEGKRVKKLSPFIFEALGEHAISVETIRESVQPSLFVYDVNKLSVDEPGFDFHIDYLSVSQIEAFAVCPLHFKLRYIYKIPTPPSASSSFGTSIHAALKLFYERVGRGEKPGERLILDCLKMSWIDEGFISREQEKQFYNKGKIYLEGYLKNGFDRSVKTIALEQPFIMNLSPEIPHSDSSGQRTLKIGGKIDRIDELEDGSIEIIDYKTSARIPSQQDVDNDLQLTFYALAASGVKEYPFARKAEKVKLSLYFLDNQEKISTQRTAEDLSKAVEEIFTIKEEIEKSSFVCSKNIICKDCEFKIFCNAED
jgi:DNA helicase-2/ATP-dependent DNA helicase PcrA